MTVPQAPSQVSPQTPGSSLSSPDTGGLDDPSLFLNRELSWLEFNQRVLDEASDPTVPLLERVKFLSIMCSNLDEFFMVRVAGTKQQIASGLIETGPDGMLPQDVLGRVGQRAQKMVSDLYRLWQKDLQPCLHQVGIDILSVGELDLDQRRFAYNYFNAQVYPALTPLAVDPGHPFPNVRNKTLNLAILLQRGTPGLRGQEASFAVMQVPSVFSRLIEIPASSPRRAFVCLEDVISLHVADLFPGAKVLGCWPFRVLRNFDMTIDEDESMDLLQTIQKEVRRRDRQPAVRMDCHAGMDLSVRRFLEGELELSGQDVFPVAGPLNLADLMEVYAKSPAREVRDLYDEPFVPKVPSRLQDASTMFEAIVQGDILLHQPYESFESVVDFIEEAAEDPNVLAMKATLYRTSGNSPIVAALVRAAELGKQVTALVELKARFDEENNIVWARKLEEAGVHVVYGLMGLKTHCKVALVVRREGGSIRRYVHLSTGNYNSQTAKVYTDLSFFTCREEFGIDASALFNMLTGYSQPPKWHRFVIAPLGLRERILEHIDAEAQNARAGRSARIIAKMNALSERDVIKALYRASQAGVQIDLLVRGVCCLRPDVPGFSDNIRVVSIVDRFLEHSRIFYFESDGKRDVYVSSADWMNRNFQRRVEVMFPVEDPKLRARIVEEILQISLCDNLRVRKLRKDGSYERVQPMPQEQTLRSQARFVELAKAQATVPIVDRGLAIRPTMRLVSRTGDGSDRATNVPPKTPTRSLSLPSVPPSSSEP